MLALFDVSIVAILAQKPTGLRMAVESVPQAGLDTSLRYYLLCMGAESSAGTNPAEPAAGQPAAEPVAEPSQQPAAQDVAGPPRASLHSKSKCDVRR